jgi:hypothetical protein
MSGLSALKFVASKPQQGNSPKHARRLKLSNKLHEQIQMAKAVQFGTEFLPVKIRTIKDEVTGETSKVEIPKRLKPWWWLSENGKMCLTVRYGARTLEVVEGKNAIETENIAGVITTLEVLRTAVDAGELDARIEAVSGLVKAGFEKETASSKRSTLKLSAKAN